MHAVIEAIYEPLFCNTSFGKKIRPKVSTQSALLKVYLTANKHNWVIQGDINQCFDSIPHSIILKRIGKNIGDPMFMNLLANFLEGKAGHIDAKSGKTIHSETGRPQGGILTPILSNVVLHELDSFMDKNITEFRKGTRRRFNPQYKNKSLLAKRGSSDSVNERRSLLMEMRKLKSVDMFDPNFKRMNYVRYADDFIVLISGSLKQANFIKSKIKDFLKVNCGLELNAEKTVISNIATDKWSFLGAQMSMIKYNPSWLVKHGNKRIIGTPKILMNADIMKILDSFKKAGIVRQNLNQEFLPQGVTSMVNLSHYEIISFYNSKIHGIINFYSFASNRNSLHSVI